MKIKLNELTNKVEALNYLVEQPIPVLASFKLSKMARLINEELTDYEKVRIDLIKKYGTTNEETGQTSIAPGSEEMTKFLEELKPILEEEVELNLEPIPVSDLGEDFKIGTKHLLPLIDFVIKE